MHFCKLGRANNAMWNVFRRDILSRKYPICKQNTRDVHYLLNNSASALLNTDTSVQDSNRRSLTTTYFHSLFYDAKPVLFMQELLLQVHDVTGLTWCPSIVLTVFCLRTIATLPLAIYQHYILAKYENLMPEIMALSRHVMSEVQIYADRKRMPEKAKKTMFALNLKHHVNQLIIRDNCHPYKSFVLVLVQLPLWFSISLGLRNLVMKWPNNDFSAQVTFYQLSVGGALWFPDLTIPDHTWLLPVMLGIINLSIIELHALRAATSNKKMMAKVVQGCYRVLAVVSVPIAATLPTCISLYWCTSSLIALGQNVLLLKPSVRRFCKIPKTPSESETPFDDIWNNLQIKLRIKK